MLGSLLLAAGLAAGPAPSDAPRCEGTLSNWTAAKAPLARSGQVKNTMRLEERRLLWNGVELDEPTARQYLQIVTQMSPQPLTVLTYGARTPCESVRRTRSLVQDVLGCKPGKCLEVVPSRR